MTNKDLNMNATPIQSTLLKKVLLRLFLAVFVLASVFFISAGTFQYWEAWVYILVLIIPATCTMLYLMKKAPDLLERRMKMREKEAGQKSIVKSTYLFFLAAFIIPGLDKRFGWSEVQPWMILLADLMILIGYFLFIWVLKENRYASRVIEVDQKQTVITTGPYSLVRHPMYASALLIYICSPLALGSFWAMIPTVFLVLMIIARLLQEEKFLKEKLEGYLEYTTKTKYRLIPGIW